MRTQIDFLGKRHVAFLVSLVLILISGVTIGTRGLNYGIDFVGGTELVIKTSTGADIAAIRKVVDDLEVGDTMVQRFGDETSGEYLIRIEGVEEEEGEESSARALRGERKAAAWQEQEEPAPAGAPGASESEEGAASSAEGDGAEAQDSGEPAAQGDERTVPQSTDAGESAGSGPAAPVAASSTVGARVMQALRDELDEGRQEGRFDLNAAQARDLTRLLQTLAGDETQAADLADRIVNYRREAAGGILTDWSEIDKIDGLPPETRPWLESNSYLGGFVQLKAEVVGPTIGRELRWKALLAIFWSLLGILGYVWMRFELRFSVASICALVHDIIIVVGFLSLFGEEFSLPMIAALLTIVGYSLNDTIVVFDRVRENLRVHRGMQEVEVLNTSINQTLSRTLLTSGTTLLVVLSLLVLGGPVIHGFAVALLLGVIVGTYSSIYVASPVVLYWRKLKPAQD